MNPNGGQSFVTEKEPTFISIIWRLSIVHVGREGGTWPSARIALT